MPIVSVSLPDCTSANSPKSLSACNSQRVHAAQSGRREAAACDGQRRGHPRRRRDSLLAGPYGSGAALLSTRSPSDSHFIDRNLKCMPCNIKHNHNRTVQLAAVALIGI